MYIPMHENLASIVIKFNLLSHLRSQRFKYKHISPFMIEGISVQKSLTTDKDGDVVGGIVDLKLKKAEEEFKANIVFQNNISSIVESSFNPRATLQLSNRFFNNKLRVILVGNYENIDRSSERMSVTNNRIEERRDGSVYINLRNASYWSSLLNRERYSGSIYRLSTS